MQPPEKWLLKMGNKNDRVDVRKLAELLRSGLLSRVYHGENGVRDAARVGPQLSGPNPRKRSKQQMAIRGLNANHNHDLKNIFKGAAIPAAAVPGPFQQSTPTQWPPE